MAGFSHVSTILASLVAEFGEFSILRWAVKPVGYTYST